MKIQEIRKMTKDEINQKIIFLKKELFDTKLKLNLAQFKDISRIRKIKKIIAKMKTILNEQKNIKKSLI